MNIRKAVDYSAMFAALEAAMDADLPQMELYCEIGKIVCARSEKGAAVAAAEFLKEQYSDMTGFSPRNVRRMRNFWQLYSSMPELLGEALCLNWTQNVVIMEAELTAEERYWYIQQAAAQNLSKTELLRTITDPVYLESVLDEKVDVWYNDDNDEISERTQYEENSVYLPWKDLNQALKARICSLIPFFARVLACLYYQYTTIEQNYPKPQYDMNTRAAVSENGGGCFYVADREITALTDSFHRTMIRNENFCMRTVPSTFVGFFPVNSNTINGSRLL